MIMAHESHHQPYIDFSSPSAAGSHSIQAGFEPHPDLFGLSPIPNPNYWRGLNPNPVAGATSPTPWPNQGLSLSLSNPKVSTDAIGFHLSSSEPRGELNSHSHQPQLFMEDYGRFFQSQQLQLPYQVRSSRYLIPAQELLMEFCNLGESSSNSPKNKGVQKGTSSQWEEGGPSNNSLYSMDLAELQKRKAKLVSMLEELFRRYRRYCEQMRSVVSSFEAVAGEGAAAVYSALASRAMSRHFRCLRDGIMGQIKATKKAMGEKDAVAPGSTKGETPRLKMLEQCLRQQKAFQQAGLMEAQPWRPQRGLPERSVSVLRAWLFEHFLHPYPSDVDKHILARQTGLSRSQVSNWFINARVRLWKPMVEEMYMEELKDEETSNSNPNHNPSSSQLRGEDQKPAPGQLLNDSDSLASIINSKIHNPNLNPNNGQQIPPRANNFGVVDLDFSSYNSVSLTLGLQQQHDRGGMSLSFSPATQHSLLFSRENMDDGRPVQFSILDGEEQNLPYRNLMGAQLLHDLAG